MNPEPPYPIPPEQQLACPKCSKAFRKWPVKSAVCDRCGTRCAPCVSREDGLTRLLYGLQYEEWLRVDRAIQFELSIEQYKERLEHEYQMLARMHRERVDQIRDTIYRDDHNDQEYGLNSLLSYAEQLELPTWPELAQKVDRLHLHRQLEMSTTVDLRFRFVMQSRSPCEKARLLDKTIRTAEEWDADFPKRQPECIGCHCRLFLDTDSLFGNSDFNSPAIASEPPLTPEQVAANAYLDVPKGEVGEGVSETPSMLKRMLGWGK